MDDPEGGLTWDRNRQRREQLWAKSAAPTPLTDPNPEPAAAGAPAPDGLAACRAVLAERIAVRRTSRERMPPGLPAPGLADRAATREARARQRAEDEATLAEHPRPRTRGDCAGGPRPCPWAGCRFHLYLDANPETGLLKLQKRDLLEMEHTCALDLADERQGMQQAEIAEVLGVTRQRVEQLERRGRLALGRARERLQ